MNIIKFDAIDSTNSYLKKAASLSQLESYTVVVANKQTSGRGQLGTQWLSEPNKNLTFSVLIKFEAFKVSRQFYLSMAVSLGVLNAIKAIINDSFYIKWPNDILAGKDKIAGILIENVLSGDLVKQSVIGIGLNVNQTKFPKEIGAVTSLKNIAGKDIDREQLLTKIVNQIKQYVVLIENNEFKNLKQLYLKDLYKMNTPSMFEDKKGQIFMGKIIGVTESGKLEVELENEKTRKFNLKEIKFASL